MIVKGRAEGRGSQLKSKFVIWSQLREAPGWKGKEREEKIRKLLLLRLDSSRPNPTGFSKESQLEFSKKTTTMTYFPPKLVMITWLKRNIIFMLSLHVRTNIRYYTSVWYEWCLIIRLFWFWCEVTINLNQKFKFCV